MKKIFTCLFVGVLFFGCGGDEPSPSSATTGSNCGTHNGQTLHLGPQGGCYYNNSNGNKTYVDRKECKC